MLCLAIMSIIPSVQPGLDTLSMRQYFREKAKTEIGCNHRIVRKRPVEGVFIISVGSQRQTQPVSGDHTRPVHCVAVAVRDGETSRCALCGD